jgi:perosamine synthetase
MITTASERLAERARLMRSHAASTSDLARHESADVLIEEYDEAGFNFRMSDVHAAIGLAQIDRLSSLIERRRALAATYDEAFSSLESVAVVAPRPGYLHTYQSYCIVLTDASPMNRADAMRALKEQGITTRRGCMAVHLEPYIVRRFGLTRLAEAERLAARGIAIPLFPTMTADQQAHVIERVWDLLH